MPGDIIMDGLWLKKNVRCFQIQGKSLFLRERKDVNDYQKQDKSLSTVGRGQLTLRCFLLSYYIVILNCMKYFFCRITAVNYLCFKCKKTNIVIPRNSWTL